MWIIRVGGLSRYFDVTKCFELLREIDKDFFEKQILSDHESYLTLRCSAFYFEDSDTWDQIRKKGPVVFEMTEQIKFPCKKNKFVS